MRKSNKKGFTIVELVIVIAVIAILAAVLIPTFVSLTKKANQSADIQAVRQMNTALAIYNATEQPKDLYTAIMALNEQQIKLDNYHPLTSGAQFYWVQSLNRVLYAELGENGSKTVLYPEEYKSETYTPGDWFVLDGTCEREVIDYTSAVSNGAITIKTAGQFAQLAEDYVKNSGSARTVTKITLDGDIYLDGAQASFGQISNNLEIDGANHTIYGLRTSTYVSSSIYNKHDKTYGCGIFGKIDSNVTVTVKNVTFVGMSVGDPSMVTQSRAGLLAGEVLGNLNINGVSFKNCSVTGLQHVGALVGNVDGTVNISENVSFTNVTVRGYGCTAKLIGNIKQNATVTVSSGVALSGEGVTVEMNTAGRDSNETSLKDNQRTWEYFELNGDKFIAWLWDTAGVFPEGKEKTGTYAPLCTDALAWKAVSNGSHQLGGITINIEIRSISTFSE